MSEQSSVTNHQILLDRSENPYGPAPACLDVLRNASAQDLSFYSRDYERKVKSKLSERLSELLDLPEEQILLSYGSEDMLKQAVHCYLRPGDKILTPDLSWWYYKSVATEVDGVTVEYSIKESSNRFYYDVMEISEKLKAAQPRILLIASPNNPTGNGLSRTNLKFLLEQLNDTILILDEAYRGFTHAQDDEDPRFVQQYDNLLILRTFSKFYALAALRIGYALTGKKLGRFRKFSARYLGYNVLSERLALAALESSDYYAKIRERIIEDRNRYLSELNSIPGWKAYESDANFILVRTPSGTITALRKLLESKSIKVKFFLDERLHNFVQITIGTREQNEYLLSVLKEFVHLSHPVRMTAPL